MSKKNSKSVIRNPKPEIDIKRVAKLANLGLTSDQKTTFSKQLKEILSYFNKLNEVKTNNIEPIGQITGLVNITRRDETAPSLTQKAILKNAPKIRKGFLEVDAIFEQGS